MAEVYSPRGTLRCNCLSIPYRPDPFLECQFDPRRARCFLCGHLGTVYRSIEEASRIDELLVSNLRSKTPPLPFSCHILRLSSGGIFVVEAQLTRKKIGTGQRCIQVEDVVEFSRLAPVEELRSSWKCPPWGISASTVQEKQIDCRTTHTHNGQKLPTKSESPTPPRRHKTSALQTVPAAPRKKSNNRPANPFSLATSGDRLSAHSRVVNKFARLSHD